MEITSSSSSVESSDAWWLLLSLLLLLLLLFVVAIFDVSPHQLFVSFTPLLPAVRALGR